MEEATGQGCQMFKYDQESQTCYMSKDYDHVLWEEGANNWVYVFNPDLGDAFFNL